MGFGAAGRPIIKAFNNLLAQTLVERGTASGTPGRIAISVAGNDTRAKKLVSELIDDTGFDVVDAGSLAESWRQQPGTPAYCTELTVPELTQALAHASQKAAPQARDYIMARLSERVTPSSHEDLVAGNRAMQPGDPNQR